MNWIRTAPAIRYSAEAKKLVQNDVLLHNTYLEHLRSWLLPRGDRFLVSRYTMEP